MTEPATKANEPSTMVLSPLRVAVFLFAVVVVVVVTGTLANICIYHVVDDLDGDVASVLKRFDLGHEPSIPNFYSAVAVLLASGLLALIGYLEKGASAKGWHNWWLLAAIFLALAIDEAVQFHEMLNAAIKLVFESSGSFSLPWVFAGGAFAILFACYFVPFIASKSKRTLKLFLLAGGIFVGGAIGMEVVASLIFSSAGGEESGVALISHTISQTIEEFCEMLGIVIFIYALLDYMRIFFGEITIRLDSARQGGSGSV